MYTFFEYKWMMYISYTLSLPFLEVVNCHVYENKTRSDAINIIKVRFICHIKISDLLLIQYDIYHKYHLANPRNPP